MNSIREMRQTSRVLAIDTRPRRFGYVGLGDGRKLLVARAARFTSMPAARMRLAEIFDELRPTVLVLRRIRPGSSRDWLGARKVQHFARVMARQLSARVVSMSEPRLSAFCRTRNLRNKHEVAMFIVKAYPELTGYQVRRRKPWEPEHRYMLIFDAAALALVYLSSFE